MMLKNSNRFALIVAIAMMAVLLAACKAGQSIDRNSDRQKSSAKIAGLAVLTHDVNVHVACPSLDFPTFLAAYLDSVEVQKVFTSIPLQIESVDAISEPEPKTVHRMLTAEELRFPLMPSTQKQERDGLKLSQSMAGNEWKVSLRKDDTDYQVSFFFRRNECWTLYRMRDDSLSL